MAGQGSRGGGREAAPIGGAGWRSLCAAGLCLLAACSPAQQPAPPAGGGLTVAALPAGQALSLDGVPISFEDLERTAAAFALLYPAESAPASRRRALTNLLLPRAALAAAYGRERALAREQTRGLVPPGPPPPPPPAPEPGWPDGFTDLGAPPAPFAAPCQYGVLAGPWLSLGVDLWALARSLAYPNGSPAREPWPSPWIGPVEGLGRFGWLRILEHQPAADPARERYALELIVWPYVPAETLREPEAELRGRRLLVADPDLAEAVQARLVGLLETPPPAPTLGPPAPAPGG
jgi:hypothetical protein